MLTELEERKLEDKKESASSPANDEGEDGGVQAICRMTEVNLGSPVSEGPDAVPEEDGGHLQQPAEGAVRHSPGGGLLPGAGGQEGVSGDLRLRVVRHNSVLKRKISSSTQFECSLFSVSLMDKFIQDSEKFLESIKLIGELREWSLMFKSSKTVSCVG